MLDRLITIALSVATTLALSHFLSSRPSSAGSAAGLGLGQTTLRELIVDRLIVREELIVSDTGKAWDDGFEAQEIPRGIVARSLARTADNAAGTAGLWVRSRLIKTEIDDPFDDRFHAIHRDGAIWRAPGHISWNAYIGGAWRQMAIIQGEGLEWSESPEASWNGGNHPGRLRFQTFRPHHSEPLTDAIIGQGGMSIGGGGYGGGGLPYPAEALELWGGRAVEHALPTPSAPRVVDHDGSGTHEYALIAVGPHGRRGPASPVVVTGGRAALAWDSVAGADAYFVLRDGRELAGPLRIEGSEKHWRDAP
jgi:hypothetical protein